MTTAANDNTFAMKNVFRPRGANHFERLKATIFAQSIRDEDHAGKGRVEIFDEE